MTRRRLLLVVLLVLAALIAGGFAAYAKGTSELPVYVTGAERMLAGEPISRADDAKPFTYPPFFALPVVPLLTLAGVAAALTLLPDLLCPADDGRLWCIAWFETFLTGLKPGGTAEAAGAWNAGSYLNQSLTGTLHRLLTPLEEGAPFVKNVVLFDAGPALRKVLILGAQVAVVGLLAVAAWPRRSADERERRWLRFGAAAAIACGMVLLSPMSSKSHFAVLVLPIGYCVARLRFGGGDAVTWVLLALAFLLGPLTMKGLIGKDLGNLVLAGGAVTWHTLVVLACTAHVRHRLPWSAA